MQNKKGSAKKKLLLKTQHLTLVRIFPENISGKEEELLKRHRSSMGGGPVIPIEKGAPTKREGWNHQKQKIERVSLSSPFGGGLLFKGKGKGGKVHMWLRLCAEVVSIGRSMGDRGTREEEGGGGTL